MEYIFYVSDLNIENIIIKDIYCFNKCDLFCTNFKHDNVLNKIKPVFEKC